jgi:hypothetical protein
MRKETAKVIFLGLLIFWFFLGVEEGFSFCLSCLFKQTPKVYHYKIEYSKPVFLDIEHLRKNRSIYVVLIGFNVKEGLEEKAKGYLFEELKRVGMNVVSDSRQGAYLMKIYLKKVDEDEVVVDILIRERPEVKDFEGKVKVYASDLDSVDHLTTLKIKKMEKEGEKEGEDEIFKKLMGVLAGLFKTF